MPYYGMGDYYRGDYYRGDPFLGGLIAAVGGPIVKKFGTKIAKFGGKLLGRGASAAGTVATVGTAVGVVRAGAPAPPGMIRTPGVRGTVQRVLPGGETGFTRRRRMNPANPKALRRALRRVSGFAKLAQRTKRDIGRAATAAGVRRSAPKKGRR